MRLKENMFSKSSAKILLLYVLFVFNIAHAEIIHPYEPGNLLTVTVLSEVVLDTSTQIYTYKYTVVNHTGSQQELETFALDVVAGIQIIDSTSPTGWNFGVHSDKPLISWGAVDYEPLPEGTVVTDDDLPSSYTIKAGETLTGFSIQTMTAPDVGAYYARGFTKTPTATSEADFELMQEAPHFTKDSFVGETTLPIKSNFLGGRRPAVDGFLGFLNIQKRNNVFRSPALIVLKFSMADENVYRNTFKAELNGIDVTNLFQQSDMYGGDLTAIFDTQSTPLKIGRNVLITRVDGQVPGTTRNATDTDRITLSVE